MKSFLADMGIQRSLSGRRTPIREAGDGRKQSYFFLVFFFNSSTIGDQVCVSLR